MRNKIWLRLKTDSSCRRRWTEGGNANSMTHNYPAACKSQSLANHNYGEITITGRSQSLANYNHLQITIAGKSQCAKSDGLLWFFLGKILDLWILWRTTTGMKMFIGGSTVGHFFWRWKQGFKRCTVGHLLSEVNWRDFKWGGFRTVASTMHCSKNTKVVIHSFFVAETGK